MTKDFICPTCGHDSNDDATYIVKTTYLDTQKSSEEEMAQKDFFIIRDHYMYDPEWSELKATQRWSFKVKFRDGSTIDL